MFEKWYKIVGLTEGLVNDWQNELREDLIIWKENDNLEARIRLNPIEAIRMGRDMKNYNKQQPYYKLQLVPA